MKITRLSDTPLEPVSHDPQLKKRVLLEDVGGLRRLSHIVLPAGSRASLHSHRDLYEVFYIVRGRIVFVIDGKECELTHGTVLAVEPGEAHEIKNVPEECEMVYVHV